MKCGRCQHENPPEAKFCLECGTTLALRCSGCGTRLPAGAKFCLECGQPTAQPTGASRFSTPDAYTPRHLADRILTSKASLEGERKQVTVLFADLKGSMELLADRDPEEARKLLDPVLEHMMEAVHRYEGTVNQVMGDGIMALFGAPLAQEDHALRATYAALRMQETIRRYAAEVQRGGGAPVQIRVGLNSGGVVVRSIGSDLHMDYTAVGQTTHLAARLEQIAMPGSILIAAETLRLAEGFVDVRSLGPVSLKGLEQPVEVFEVTGARPARSRLEIAAARGLTPFVGREAELDRLHEALAQAGAGRGQVVAVVGEPGVGKSRLCWELTRSHRTRGWLVLESGSLSYGKADPYRPVVDLLRRYFGIDEADEPRTVRAKVTGHLLTLDEALRHAIPPVLELLDAGPEDSTFRLLDPRQRRDETIEALRRLFVRESQSRPVVLVFEDLHWIDAETQALLDALVDGLGACRMLLLTTYRPEYQHGWGGKSHYAQLRIDPLSAAGSEELLQALLGDAEDLAGLKQLLVERTEGNPFFLEETVRTLVETGTLAGERGAYRLRGSAESLQVPPTVHAVLAARIDRLAPEDKDLLQSAAVIGHDVPLALLQAVAALPQGQLRPALARLQAAEFLYESSLFPDIQYSFKHALTHEVVYGGLLRDRAKALHSRVLGALEDLLGERRLEQAEVLARHALRAENWDRAVHYLHAAARRAYGRTALSEAIERYEQALALMPRLPESEETLRRAVDLRLDLHFPLFLTAQTRRLSEVHREAETFARQLGDLRRLGHVAHRQGYVALFGTGSREAGRYAEEAFRIAMTLEDRELRILARYLQGTAHLVRSEFHQAIESFLLIVDGPDAELARGIIAMTGPAYPGGCGWLAWALSFVGDFERALIWGERGVAAADAMGHLQGQALTSFWRGAAAAERGEFAEALPWLDRGIRLCTQHGLTAAVALFASGGYGSALAWSGRSVEGLFYLEQAVTMSDSLGTKVGLARNHFLLAEGLLLAGRLAEAVRAAERALDVARAEEDRGSESAALHVLGEVARLADPPDSRCALARQQEALAIATDLGLRPLAARCHLAIGRVLAQTGQLDPARGHLATAATMFGEMGMRFWLGQAQPELERLG